MTTTIEYIGHSAVYIYTENHGILIDPFITDNPKANFDIKDKNVNDILVTHAHADHLGDAIPISRAKKAVVTATFELANFCAQRGAYTNGINLGGKIAFDWGSARFLPAFHSSSTPDGQYAGMPASILLEINGIKIYHAGDTCLNQEMKTVGEVYKPDIAFLPVGSHFTMDTKEAIIAAQWLNTKKVVPIHYNTFDLIKTDLKEFETELKNLNIEPIILSCGEKINL